MHDESLYTGETVISLSSVNEQERKAQDRNAMIIFKKDVNKTRFVQVIQQNMGYLLEHKVLSTSNLALIMRIIPFIELQSNMLVKGEDHNQMITITYLAKKLELSRPSLSSSITVLAKLGIVHEIVNVAMIRKYGATKEERPIFLNPEIVFAGDKNKIDLTLTRLHIQNDQLEKRGILLPYKVWLNQTGNAGRLYSRSTYLRRKSGTRKI